MVARNSSRRRATSVGITKIPGPFYLLSALMMMVGCYTLAHSLDLKVAAVPKLLALIVIVNLYEAMLIGLGVYLIRHRRLLRDGVLLLMLELPFLFDMTYLNTELISASRSVPGFAGVLLGLLMLAKIFAVIRALGIPVTWPHWTPAVSGIVVMVGTPTWLDWRSVAGEVGVTQLYAACWAVGLIGAVHGVIWVHASAAEHASVTKRRLAAAFWIVLYGSLVGHLVALGWVYQSPWHWAYLAPLALAVGAWSRYWDWRPAAQLAWPAAAVLLSLEFPPELIAAVGPWNVSPLRLALVAAGLCYGWFFWLGRSWAAAISAVAAVALATLGHSPATIGFTLRGGWDDLKAHFPSSGVFWGLTSMVIAFVLLGIGAALSLRTRRRPVD